MDVYNLPLKSILFCVCASLSPGCFEHYHLLLLPPVLLPRPAGLHHAAWRLHHCCCLRPQLLLTGGKSTLRLKPGFRKKSSWILYIMKSLEQCHGKCGFQDMFEDVKYLLLHKLKIKETSPNNCHIRSLTCG